MRSFLVLMTLSTLLGCNYHIVKHPIDSGGSQGDLGLSNQPIGWDLIRLDVLHVCLQCHSGLKPPLLSSYASMVQEIGRVWDAASGGVMPPPSSGLSRLSVCRTAILRKWMDLGTPQTSTVTVSTLSECPKGAGEIPIAQMPLNYQTLRAKILEPRCLHCHNPSDNTDAGAILFAPYSELMQESRRWSAPARDSKVIHLLRSADLEERMPPPEDGEALKEDEIQFIERWIDAGKPEF